VPQPTTLSRAPLTMCISGFPVCVCVCMCVCMYVCKGVPNAVPEGEL
jgi:hypothetical protein